jgi:hypothetical protein
MSDSKMFQEIEFCQLNQMIAAELMKTELNSMCLFAILRYSFKFSNFKFLLSK